MSHTVDAVVPLLVTVVTLCGGWLVSSRVADRWDRIKKQREMDLASALEFQRLYGEFFATWKCWDTLKRYGETTGLMSDVAWSFLERSAAIEGGIEALLAKVAGEKNLSDRDIEVLGRMRQGFQSLRKAIREDSNLDWRGTDNYKAFKELAAYTSKMMADSRLKAPLPDVQVSMTNFLRITDVAHGVGWSRALDGGDQVG